MEKKIIEILRSYNQLNEIKSNFNTLIESSENNESAQSLRDYTISKLGWSEKSKELDSGGELKDDLTKIINDLAYTYASSAPGCKGRFTAGNDSYHKGITKYKSLHTQGMAVDVAIDDTKCRPKFIELLNRFTTQYPGFSYIDEYKNPTEKSTGGHFHISYRKGDSEKSKTGTKEPKTKGETGDVTNQNTSVSDSEFGNYDPLLANIGKQLLSPKLGKNLVNPLKEQFSPEKSRFKSGGRILLPSNKNSKIYSPTIGEVTMWSKNSCRNGFSIITVDNYLIEFCNADEILVRNGSMVDPEDIIAKTHLSDVQVTFYKRDKSPLGNIPPQYISSSNNRLTPKGDDDKNKNKGQELSVSDPLLASAFTAIPKMFQNQYDEKTGKLKQKRWGSPTEKTDVDPWILQTAAKPFNKIKKMFSSNNVNEDIEKIKKLIK